MPCMNDLSLWQEFISYFLLYRLFDMDGTLVDSTAGVVGAWHTFKETYPDLNVEEILNSRSFCGILYLLPID